MTRRVLFDPSRGASLPIFLWADDATEETLRQLHRVASMPYVVGHVGGMADAHMASGVAVGTVFATLDVVVPGALGSDIGCGMSAVRIRGDLDASSLDRRVLERLLLAWASAIPVGEATHRGRGVLVPSEIAGRSLSTRDLERTRDRLASRHLGTLGGGNHFVELDRDAAGALWLLVHSGSRGLGGAIGHHHARVARALGGPTDPLTGLSIGESAGESYVQDHSWALDFAVANRALLARYALEALASVSGAAIDAEPAIDVPHNFVRRERWVDREVLVHRKGAAPAASGELALVPGSMGTASYIVQGRGSPDSFGSCSHGAGRVLSRGDARREIGAEALRASMRRVVFPESHARALVEEAPAAYRDIRRVLAAQDDLIVPRLRLEPLMVLKG